MAKGFSAPNPADFVWTLTYQRPIRTVDGYNDINIAWEDSFDIEASITPVKPWELVKYRSVQMNVSHQIGSWWNENVKADGRFVKQEATGPRYFDIFGIVNVDEQSIEMVILANEVVKPQ